MRLDNRLWLFTESLHLAVAGIAIFVVILGGLWCLIAILTSLRQKARRADDRW